MPTVSHESNSAAALNAKKAGTFVKGGGLEGKEFKIQITKVDQFTGESEVVEGEPD